MNRLVTDEERPYLQRLLARLDQEGRDEATRRIALTSVQRAIRRRQLIEGLRWALAEEEVSR
jgi:hypothetical protein